jgi:hypothetical protein
VHEKEGFIEMIFFFNFSKQDHFKMTEELLFSGEKGSRKVHFCFDPGISIRAGTLRYVAASNE